MARINEENHKSNGGKLVGNLYSDGEYYVLDLEGEIAGYINLLEEEPERFPHTTWVGAPERFENAVYVRQVSIARDWQRAGFGGYLYDWLKQQFPGKPVYAHVHTENQQSMNFHLKQGFQAVGVYENECFHGVRNYRAFLFKREATN